MRTSGWMLAWGLVIFCRPAPAGEVVVELNAEERKQIASAVETTTQFKDAARADSDRRLFLTRIIKHVFKDEKTEAQEIAELLYYKYEGGVTLRAMYDVKAKKLQKLDVLPAYPTPLAPEEREAALKLARDKSPELKKLHDGFTAEEARVHYLTPVVADPKSKFYGHRIVFVSVTPQKDGEKPVKVKLDLTDKSLLPQDAPR